MNRGQFRARADRLRDSLRKEEMDGAVLVPGPNLRYLTGVESLLLERPFMLLVPAEGEAHLVAPELESGPYIEGPLELKVHSWTDSQGPDGAIGDAVREVRVKGTWGVEGKVPYLFLEKLMKNAPREFAGAETILQGLREVKDESEVSLLKRAGSILSKSFKEFPGLVKEGRTELEIARAATAVIYDNGATKVDDMLVQSGPRAADPHGLPSSKKVRRGEGVIIDVGATFEGYYADITRTYTVGKNEELEKVYSCVLEAEEQGIGASKEGVQVGKVDRAARGVIEKAGMGKHFFHRTGHGLGLEVHEAPYIVEGGRERLAEGMCFTVEPGVYIREKLGVRIEDNVLIEGKRGVALTDTPKEYGWWR